MSNVSHQSSPELKPQQTTIAELQGQIQVLQVSLSSQRELPSVGVTQEGENLRDQIFNYVPGTVNTNRAPWCMTHQISLTPSKSTSDLGDRPNQPDLESDAAGPGTTPTSPTTVPTQLPAHSSTPYTELLRD